MKNIVIVAAAMLAGFLGGILGTQLTGASRQGHPDQVIRARSFELVDEAGRAISFWGVDNENNAVLAFGSHRPRLAPAGRGGPRLGLSELRNQRASIGVIDDSPFLMLRGADGRTRVRMYLSDFGKPFLLMEDETGPRISLGTEQSDTPGPQDNDWSLAFYPEVARIGLHAEKARGQTYVQGGMFIRKDKVRYPPE
jgi:hypothetical protein